MTGPMSPEEQAIPATEWTPDAIDRLLQAVRDVPPCEEPDPSELPAELIAITALLDDLRYITADLEQVKFAVELSHDSGEAVTDKQRDAAITAVDQLSEAIFRYWDAASVPW